MVTDKPRIILLNGSSSSGKTTIAIALQQQLPVPFQHVALDQFRDGMPGRYRGLNSPPGSPGHSGLNIVPVERGGEKVTDIQFGDVGERTLRGMRRAIAAFAAAGNNVIVDDLLFKPEYLSDYVSALVDTDTWFIGVRADLETVNEREATRLGRFPGTATAHFDQVHAHGLAYDLEVDTTNLSPRECAAAIIARLRKPPEAFADYADRGGTTA